MQGTLSPKQLAQAIGMSESTMKRWADNGVVRIIRTQGGHRRIPLKECVRLIRERGLEIDQPELLGLDAKFGTEKVEDLPEFVYEALVAEEGKQAENALIKGYFNGLSLVYLFDQVIVPCMSRIGKLWTHESSGIAVEHYATDVCLGVVARLRSFLTDIEGGETWALGCSLSGDPYRMGSLMTATIFESEGFGAKNYGANLPLDVLIERGIREDVKVVWVSVSFNPKPKHLIRDLWLGAERLAKRGIQLVVGGRAIQIEHRFSHDAVHYMQNMAELSGYLKGFNMAGNPNRR